MCLYLFVSLCVCVHECLCPCVFVSMCVCVHECLCPCVLPVLLVQDPRWGTAASSWAVGGTSWESRASWELQHRVPLAACRKERKGERKRKREGVEKSKEGNTDREEREQQTEREERKNVVTKCPPSYEEGEHGRGEAVHVSYHAKWRLRPHIRRGPYGPMLQRG